MNWVTWINCDCYANFRFMGMRDDLPKLELLELLSIHYIQGLAHLVLFQLALH